MCSLWLKFVAPLVAEATRAEGNFSLSLQGAAVPIATPLASDLAGTLAVHSAQIGPGPLAQQYLALARQLRTLFDANAAATSDFDPHRGWLILPQQEVTFEVAGGAVHHRGLKMAVKDVVITTEGSVSIQTQEINLLASVPLQESWFKRQDGFFATLKGKTIQIPIRGTLTQPRVDARILQDLGQQLVGSAVQGQLEKQLERGTGLLQKELGKGLDKLLGPLQPQPPPPSTTSPPR
jgi:translocation and assembly module TamB